MEVLLITVSSEKMRQIRGTRYIRFQQCTMPYLASFFPGDWNVRHIDEECEPVDYGRRYDIVGITFHLPCAPHAYEMAARFREQGSLVLMGGPHVTLVPEEAARHADVIFVGEAEETLPEFLGDFCAGTVKSRYECWRVPGLAGVPFAKKELFHRKDHTAGTLTASRGCPNRCEFCAVSVMYQNRLRRRPVEEAAAEYGSFRGKVIIFWDDNIAADPDWAKELFRAVAPYKKWWSSQCSISAGEDDEFLELAAKSGCKQLFIGLESISQASLDGASKTCNRADRYKSLIRNIHAHGIAVQAGIVFGFDQDRPEVFAQTVDFLEDAGVQNATFNILTPYPGTPLFRRLEGEGRILTRDWSKYNSRTDVVFTPKNMTRQQILAGFRYVNKRFYSLESIARRLSRSPVGLFWTLPLNLVYRHLLLTRTQKRRPALPSRLSPRASQNRV